MPFAAVLDASVLYPLPLRDPLLRVAEIELYDAYWSDRILDEVVRNLVDDGRANDQQARHLTDAMAAAFAGAAVPQDAIDRLEPAMANDSKDRQAAALTRPPMTLDELLDRLAATVPSFAQALREHA